MATPDLDPSTTEFLSVLGAVNQDWLDFCRAFFPNADSDDTAQGSEVKRLAAAVGQMHPDDAKGLLIAAVIRQRFIYDNPGPPDA